MAAAAAPVAATEEARAAIAEASPMYGDEFDEEEAMNRRCELVELKAAGVFARTAGDPTHPLVLYVHGGGAGSSSIMWNGARRSAARRRDRAAHASGMGHGTTSACRALLPSLLARACECEPTRLRVVHRADDASVDLDARAPRGGAGGGERREGQAEAQ